MTLKTIIRLLKKQDATVEDFVPRFKRIVDKFQTEREDFYISEFLESFQLRDAAPSAHEVEQITKRVVEKINQDTENYVIAYAIDMTDQILDAVNSKQVKKDVAFSFLSLLSGFKNAFIEAEN